jgi:hypothetical protein
VSELLLHPLGSGLDLFGTGYVRWGYRGFTSERLDVAASTLQPVLVSGEELDAACRLFCPFVLPDLYHPANPLQVFQNPSEVAGLPAYAQVDELAAEGLAPQLVGVPTATRVPSERRPTRSQSSAYPTY